MLARAPFFTEATFADGETGFRSFQLLWVLVSGSVRRDAHCRWNHPRRRPFILCLKVRLHGSMTWLLGWVVWEEVEIVSVHSPTMVTRVVASEVWLSGGDRSVPRRRKKELVE